MSYPCFLTMLTALENDRGHIVEIKPSRAIIQNCLNGRYMSHLQFNPFNATRRDACHQNKVKVKGLGGDSSYLDGFFYFFHGSMKMFNQLAKRKKLKNFLKHKN